MAKTYWVEFASSGSANQYSGLSPTFTIFVNNFGSMLPGPAIAEAGVSTGMYTFNYTPSTTYSIAFQVDGGSSITSSTDRYVKGVLDPIQAVDQDVGHVTDSFGTTVLPTTVFGYVQRVVQETEADATFDKSTGVWDNYAKGTSLGVLLYEKLLTNNTTEATKT